MIDIEEQLRRLARICDRREMGWLAFTGWGAACVLAAAVYSLAGPLAWVALAMASAFWVRTGFRLHRLGREQVELQRALCRAGDPRALGSLAIGLLNAEGPHRAEVHSSIERLLDAFSSEVPVWLTRKERAALRRVLLHEADADLSLAILRAYERIGGPYEREIVRMLAEGPQTRTRDACVQNAAQRCLTKLDPEYRVRLLRPAAAPDLLLRPMPAGAGESDSLLLPDPGELK